MQVALERPGDGRVRAGDQAADRSAIFPLDPFAMALPVSPDVGDRVAGSLNDATSSW
jgi:hypothetical protein